MFFSCLVYNMLIINIYAANFPIHIFILIFRLDLIVLVNPSKSCYSFIFFRLVDEVV